MNEHIDTLWARRNSYTPTDTKRKIDALGVATRSLPRASRSVRLLHDALRFLIAHPDSAHVHALATRASSWLSAELETRCREEGPIESLSDSGIVGAPVFVEFCFDGVRNLWRRHPTDVGIDWEDEQTPDGVDRLLSLLVDDSARDGLSDSRLSTDECLALAAGSTPGADVAWLLRRLEARVPDARIRDWVWDDAKLSVRWIPRTADACRSGAVLLPRAPHALARGRKIAFDVSRELDRVVTRPRPLAPRRAERAITAVQANLYSRQRETDAVTYANAREVFRFELERGLDVYLFGTLPERRLPIESFFGYVAARNTLPVAYGGGWVFFDRCEIGANVLEEFRGGESAWVFTQVMRVYRHVFDVRLFQVQPYQIGEENDEAIRSGAFWFYYRLGFRPADPALASSAGEEFERLTRDRTARTPARLLRRFATAPLVRTFGDRSATDVLSLARLSTEIQRGRQARGKSASIRDAARILGTSANRSATERDAFARLAPLVAAIPDLPSWSVRDKTRIARCLFAKGGDREIDYALGLRRFPRLERTVRALAGRATGD